MKIARYLCMASLFVLPLRADDALPSPTETEETLDAQDALEEGDPAEAVRRPSHLRISAIAGEEGDYYVGIVNQDTGDSRLLRVGSTFEGYEVTEIRPDSEEVHLRRDEDRYVLFLRGDETYLAALPRHDEGEGYDPDAESPEPFTSRDEFLRETAERLGMIEKDAPLPAEWTETPTPEEALRRMAESVGMPPPGEDALKPVSREEFLRMHAPAPDAPGQVPPQP